jgi:hypothetical protein
MQVRIHPKRIENTATLNHNCDTYFLFRFDLIQGFSLQPVLGKRKEKADCRIT